MVVHSQLTAQVDKRVTNALSFDIEDWFHMVEIKSVSDPAKWPTLPTLVVDYTKRILDIVGSVRSTFFVLGWVAERYPEIPKMIVNAGHELASHSFMHGRVDRMTPKEFAADLRRSLDSLEQPTGVKVIGFRAPSFSITPGAEWAFDVLHEAGFLYDASLFPAKRGQGGYQCEQRPHLFGGAPSGRTMPELPMSVYRIGPLKIPFSGGGYMRVLPSRFIRYGFEEFNKKGLPVVIYLHPRDFAVDCPRVAMPLHRHFKCYTGIKTTEGKLRMLLKNYKFDTCASVLGLVKSAGNLEGK